MTANEWQPIHSAPHNTPEGERVLTKIDDLNGVRNVAVLIRKGNLWFLSDMSMYVYYRPTHWKSHP